MSEDDDWWWGYMFNVCGEGTCGGMGQSKTYDEAWAEIEYWVKQGDYNCWIVDPDGETVFSVDTWA
jgi:hypothetical protein